MKQFSLSAQHMRSSEIRRLMKLAANPDIISFSGGMPGNELLPTTIIDKIFGELTLAQKQAALQYGPTQGYPPLLESLSEYLRSIGIDLVNNDVMITTGAQQAINLLAKIFIDPGDQVIAEYPSFIGGLAAFSSFGANLKAVNLDNEGIDIAQLKSAINGSDPDKLKMVYLIPNFQNPSGIMYSLKRRQEVVDLLSGSNAVVLEDDPYRELYFDESARSSIVPLKVLAKDRMPVCYVGSFAKICGPGLRLGWLVAPKEIIEKAELAKQSMDACSATFTQVLADSFLRGGYLGGYLEAVRKAYRRRASLMLDSLKANMPDSVIWTRPQGGFYVWVTLPQNINASDVFSRALDKGAAIVIGSAFDPLGTRNNCFRLAFSHTQEAKIEQGVEIVCKAVKAVIDGGE